MESEFRTQIKAALRKDPYKDKVESVMSVLNTYKNCNLDYRVDIISELVEHFPFEIELWEILETCYSNSDLPDRMEKALKIVEWGGNYNKENVDYWQYFLSMKRFAKMSDFKLINNTWEFALKNTIIHPMSTDLLISYLKFLKAKDNSEINNHAITNSVISLIRNNPDYQSHGSIVISLLKDVLMKAYLHVESRNLSEIEANQFIARVVSIWSEDSNEKSFMKLLSINYKNLTDDKHMMYHNIQNIIQSSKMPPATIDKYSNFFLNLAMIDMRGCSDYNSNFYDRLIKNGKTDRSDLKIFYFNYHKLFKSIFKDAFDILFTDIGKKNVGRVAQELSEAIYKDMLYSSEDLYPTIEVYKFLVNMACANNEPEKVRFLVKRLSNQKIERINFSDAESIYAAYERVINKDDDYIFKMDELLSSPPFQSNSRLFFYLIYKLLNKIHMKIRLLDRFPHIVDRFINVLRYEDPESNFKNFIFAHSTSIDVIEYIENKLYLADLNQ